MYILAIETTGVLGSVALMNGDGQLLGYKASEDPMSHLKNLVPMVDELLKEAEVDKTQLTYVAASVGPGSFTGIRIGVATARALCQSLNFQAIAVPTLEGFLRKEEARKGREKGRICCVIINARRGQVYGMIEGYMEPQACMLTDVLEVIKEKIFSKGQEVLFLGDGIDAYEGQIQKALWDKGKYLFGDRSYRYQDAVSVAREALRLAEAGRTLHYRQLLPNYMRKAEAEQKLAAGQLPICKGPKQE